MKFNLPPLLASRGPDISYILDRTDLSIDEKVAMAFEKHGPVPVPFDSSYIRRYFDKFKSRAEEDEDEDEDEVDDVDEDDSESEDEDEEKSEDEKEKRNKVVLGDEKEPIGTVKRPPQEAPLEGEAICKVPRAVPPQGRRP